MTLVKATIENGVKAAVAEMDSRTGGKFSESVGKEFLDLLAEKMADAVDAYVKAATITVTGSSVSGGPVKGTGVIA